MLLKDLPLNNAYYLTSDPRFIYIKLHNEDKDWSMAFNLLRSVKAKHNAQCEVTPVDITQVSYTSQGIETSRRI